MGIMKVVWRTDTNVIYLSFRISSSQLVKMSVETFWLGKKVAIRDGAIPDTYAFDRGECWSRYSSCYGFFKKYAKVEIKIHSTY
jgi:hypothetical protein